MISTQHIKIGTCHCLLLSIAILANCLWGQAPSGPSDRQTQESEFRADVLSIENEKFDLDKVDRLIRAKSAKWKERNHPLFIKFTVTACGLLSSYDLGDRDKQALLLNEIVSDVISKNNLTISQEAQFIEFLSLETVS